MGRDLLVQDYFLKQITAKTLNPEGEIGKVFWKRIYARILEKYGTTDIPLDTLNKVWIVPGKAVVFENGEMGLAYVTESHLEVKLESDYLAQEKSAVPQTASPDHMMMEEALSTMVIPDLERVVNEGMNFATLRLVYQSLILAAWYKRKIRQSLLSAVYVDRNKVAGINIPDPGEVDRIWKDYVVSFRKGAYDFIKEEPDALFDEVLVRKYFSGGIDWAMDSSLTVKSDVWPVDLGPSAADRLVIVREETSVLPGDPAQESVLPKLKVKRSRADREQFSRLIERQKERLEGILSQYYDEPQVDILRGPGRTLTTRTLLGEIIQSDDFDSYDLVYRNNQGVFIQFNLLNGRGFDRNSLIIGRAHLEMTTSSPVILTQKIWMGSDEWGKRNLEKVLEQLKGVFMQALPQFDWQDRKVLLSFAEASVGLRQTQIESALKVKDDDTNVQLLLERLRNEERMLYPSQMYPSFPYAGALFKSILKSLEELAVESGYDSLVIGSTLPHGLANFVLYRMLGYKPLVLDKDQQFYAEEVLALLKSRNRGSLLQKSWELSRRMNEEWGILMEKPLSSLPGQEAVGGINLNPDNAQFETRNNSTAIEVDLTSEQLQQMQNAAGFSPVIISIDPYKIISDTQNY
jgi:hypothetical protein